jgi:arylesterase/paraoxonase
MRRIFKIAGIIVLLLLALVALRVLWVLDDIHAFRSIEPHFNGHCVTLAGVTGAEDIVIDHEQGVAYLSATDRNARLPGYRPASTPDGIYVLDLAQGMEGNTLPRHLPVKGLADFHPHGMDIRRLDDGRLRIFAVNHSKSGHSVEILERAGDELLPVKTLHDSLLISPNGLTATGPEALYVTNDRAGPRGKMGGAFAQFAELLLPRELTTIVYWDGTRMRAVADDLDMANGIAASPDGRLIFVNEAMGNNLRIYERTASGDLILKEELALNTSPDNVSLAPDGTVLVAGHPSIFQLLMARRSHPFKPSPSQVLELRPEGVGKDRLTEIYMNKGEEISNVTDAAPFGGDMFLMGNAWNEGVVMCKRNKL